MREDIAGGVCDNTLLSVLPVWPTRQIKILSFFLLFFGISHEQNGSRIYRFVPWWQIQLMQREFYHLFFFDF